MKAETVTYLKENASNLNVDEPLLITQNGKPKYVVQDVADYEYQQESIALLKLLSLSKNDESTISLEDAFLDE